MQSENALIILIQFSSQARDKFENIPFYEITRAIERRKFKGMQHGDGLSIITFYYCCSKNTIFSLTHTFFAPSLSLEERSFQYVITDNFAVFTLSLVLCCSSNARRENGNTSKKFFIFLTFNVCRCPSYFSLFFVQVYHRFISYIIDVFYALFSKCRCAIRESGNKTHFL